MLGRHYRVGLYRRFIRSIAVLTIHMPRRSCVEERHPARPPKRTYVPFDSRMNS